MAPVVKFVIDRDPVTVSTWIPSSRSLSGRQPEVGTGPAGRNIYPITRGSWPCSHL